MSEYLSKEALLESIGEAYQTNLESPDQTDWDEGYRSALRFIKRAVLSGAFDADNTEIQRLRAALEKVGTEEWRHKYFGAEWPKAEGDGNDA